MQSRWFEFGGDTLIRADKYAILPQSRLRLLGLIKLRVQIHQTHIGPALTIRLALLQTTTDCYELGGYWLCPRLPLLRPPLTSILD